MSKTITRYQGQYGTYDTKKEWEDDIERYKKESIKRERLETKQKLHKLIISTTVLMIIGYLISYNYTVKNQFGYRCESDDLSHNDCFTDCSFNKYDCLQICGCTQISSYKKSPMKEAVIGAISLPFLAFIALLVIDEFRNP